MVYVGYMQNIKKNHIRNVLILFKRGGVDPKSENHIKNILFSIDGGCKI